MPRGRLCDPFDRWVDAVTGPFPDGLTEDEDTEIWDDGPQSSQWAWRAIAASSQSQFGVDELGAYHKNLDGSFFVANVKTGEAQSIIIDYPAKFYMKVRTSRVVGNELGTNELGLILESVGDETVSAHSETSDGNGPSVETYLLFGTRNAYLGSITDGVTLYDASGLDSGVVQYTFAADTDYWVSLEYLPGAHIAVRIWTGDWEDEPEDAFVAWDAEEDGAVIPELIDRITLSFSTQIQAQYDNVTIWVRQIGVEQYCIPEDAEIDEVDESTYNGPIIDDFSNRTLTDSMGTASSGLVYSWVTLGAGDTYTIDGDLTLETTVATGNVSLEWTLAYDPFNSEENYPMWMAGEGTFSFRFRTSAVEDSMNDKEARVRFQHYATLADPINDSDVWDLDVFVSNAPSTQGYIEISGNGSPDMFIKTDWLANTWYKVEVEQTGSTVRARVYVDGDTPPSWQVSMTMLYSFPWTLDTSPSTGYAALVLTGLTGSDASSPSSIIVMDLDDIRFDV